MWNVYKLNALVRKHVMNDSRKEKLRNISPYIEIVFRFVSFVSFEIFNSSLVRVLFSCVYEPNKLE